MKQKRYSESFKQRMIQRMVGPSRLSATALSKEVGVAQPTLSLWLKSAGTVAAVTDDRPKGPKAKRPVDWSPEEKLSAVMEASGLSDDELGSWLRRKGLTEAHLRQWRASALSGFGARPSRGAGEDRKRVKELERELKRKDKALAETAALLVLQGKVQALWADEDASTRQSSDESSSRASRRLKKRGRD